jgi:multidrug resistance efflux pump
MADNDKLIKSHNYLPIEHVNTVSDEGIPELNISQSVPDLRPWLQQAASIVAVATGACLLLLAYVPYKIIVRSSGVIRPEGEETLINSPLSGRVSRVLVQPSEVVTRGQSLMILDQSELQSGLLENKLTLKTLADQIIGIDNQLKLNTSRGAVDVKKAESEYRFAKAELERYRSLRRAGATSASFYQEKEAAFEQSEASIKQARQDAAISQSELLQRRSELFKEKARLEKESDTLNLSLDQVIVRSPSSGSVDQLFVRSAGQTVAIGQDLATIIPSSVGLLVQAPVETRDLNRLRVGQKAKIRVDSCPFTDYGVLDATVYNISPDTGESGESYPVTLNPMSRILSSRSGKICKLKVGMSVAVDVITDQEPILLYALRKMRFLIG